MIVSHKGDIASATTKCSAGLPQNRRPPRHGAPTSARSSLTFSASAVLITTFLLARRADNSRTAIQRSDFSWHMRQIGSAQVVADRRAGAAAVNIRSTAPRGQVVGMYGAEVDAQPSATRRVWHG